MSAEGLTKPDKPTAKPRRRDPAQSRPYPSATAPSRATLDAVVEAVAELFEATTYRHSVAILLGVAGSPEAAGEDLRDAATTATGQARARLLVALGRLGPGFLDTWRRTDSATNAGHARALADVDALRERADLPR